MKLIADDDSPVITSDIAGQSHLDLIWMKHNISQIGSYHYKH